MRRGGRQNVRSSGLRLGVLSACVLTWAMATGPGCTSRFQTSKRVTIANVVERLGNLYFSVFSSRISLSNQAQYVLSGKCSSGLVTVQIRAAGTAISGSAPCRALPGFNPPTFEWSMALDVRSAPDGLVTFQLFEKQGALTSFRGEMQVRKFTELCAAHMAAPMPRGTGTPEDPFVICNLRQFQSVMEDHAPTPGKIYLLGNDLDPSDVPGFQFRPVHHFAGAFFGMGFAIRNLSVTVPPEMSPPPLAYGALFGSNFTGRINVPLEVIAMPFPIDDFSFALFINNIRVDSEGAVSSIPTGGLVGEITSGALIRNVVGSEIKVSGVDNVGGLFGVIRSLPSPAIEPIVLGVLVDRIDVSGDNNVGGVVGAMQRMLPAEDIDGPFLFGIQTFYGTLHGVNAVGGVVGSNGGWVESSAQLGNLTLLPKDSHLFGAGCVAGVNQVHGQIAGSTTGCTVSTPSSNTAHAIGGLAGRNLGTISRSVVERFLAQTTSKTGGAVGQLEGGRVSDVALENVEIYSSIASPNPVSPLGFGGAVGNWTEGNIERVAVSAWIYFAGSTTQVAPLGFLGTWDPATIAVTESTLSESFVLGIPNGQGIAPSRHPEGGWAGVTNLSETESLDASKYADATGRHWSVAPTVRSALCFLAPLPAQIPASARAWSIPTEGTLPARPRPAWLPLCGGS